MLRELLLYLWRRRHSLRSDQLFRPLDEELSQIPSCNNFNDVLLAWQNVLIFVRERKEKKAKRLAENDHNETEKRFSPNTGASSASVVKEDCDIHCRYQDGDSVTTVPKIRGVSSSVEGSKESGGAAAANQQGGNTCEGKEGEKEGEQEEEQTTEGVCMLCDVLLLFQSNLTIPSHLFSEYIELDYPHLNTGGVEEATKHHVASFLSLLKVIYSVFVTLLESIEGRILLACSLEEVQTTVGNKIMPLHIFLRQRVRSISLLVRLQFLSSQYISIIHHQITWEPVDKLLYQCKRMSEGVCCKGYQEMTERCFGTDCCQSCHEYNEEVDTGMMRKKKKKKGLKEGNVLEWIFPWSSADISSLACTSVSLLSTMLVERVSVEAPVEYLSATRAFMNSSSSSSSCRYVDEISSLSSTSSLSSSSSSSLLLPISRLPAYAAPYLSVLSREFWENLSKEGARQGQNDGSSRVQTACALYNALIYVWNVTRTAEDAVGEEDGEAGGEEEREAGGEEEREAGVEEERKPGVEEEKEVGGERKGMLKEEECSEVYTNRQKNDVHSISTPGNIGLSYPLPATSTRKGDESMKETPECLKLSQLQQRAIKEEMRRWDQVPASVVLLCVSLLQDSGVSADIAALCVHLLCQPSTFQLRLFSANVVATASSPSSSLSSSPSLVSAPLVRYLHHYTCSNPSPFPGLLEHVGVLLHALSSCLGRREGSFPNSAVIVLVQLMTIYSFYTPRSSHASKLLKSSLSKTHMTAIALRKEVEENQSAVASKEGFEVMEKVIYQIQRSFKPKMRTIFMKSCRRLVWLNGLYSVR